MTLFDGLVAFGVLAVFGWFILMSLSKKNPKIEEFIKSLSPLTYPPEPSTVSESTQQIWQEKRSMI
jgi:hypothetical protein